MELYMRLAGISQVDLDLRKPHIIIVVSGYHGLTLLSELLLVLASIS